MFHLCRSQWPRVLKRRSAAARLLRTWARIPPEAWMSVCCECCALSDRGLCDELITRREESYRPWCVIVCDLETSGIRRPWPAIGLHAHGHKTEPWLRKLPVDLSLPRTGFHSRPVHVVSVVDKEAMEQVSLPGPLSVTILPLYLHTHTHSFITDTV